MNEGIELSCDQIEAMGVRELLYGRHQVSMHGMGRVKIEVKEQGGEGLLYN